MKSESLRGSKKQLARLARQMVVAQLLGVLALSTPAAGLQQLRGHVPEVARRLVPVGRLAATQRLDLAIGLPLRNQTELADLLKEIYDRACPLYHRYLTPAEFTQRFGPGQQDYEAVKAFAQSNRFAIRGEHPNRMLLDVSASVADIERALHLKLQVYQHPSEDRTFYAPDAEPSIDVAVLLLDISGLDDYKLPRPLLHPATQLPEGKGGQPAYGSGPGGLYRGNDFRAAYAPNVAANGQGQSVGLFEFDGYYASDITSYETQCGLPNVPLANVLLDNFNGSPGSANVEVALDIEMAIAMAPGLNQVIVYEAGPRGIPNDILNRMATDNSAKELSSSWTWSGNPSATTDQIFQQFAAQGQSFFQASGDSDAYTGPIGQPADNPYITVVGGTTLSTSGPGGVWVSETTWNWYNSGTGTNGTGGGTSTSYLIPAWQQGISMSANLGSTTMRNIPDVALAADNIWVTYNNGSSGGFGGTSCAAPLWAGFTALINQQALGNGKPLVGFINPAIYSIGKGAGYTTAFHDITTGNNTNNSSPNKFFAVSGLDLCTGWGTPVGGGLIDALAGAGAAQIVSNSLVLAVEACPNNAVDPGETVTMNFGLVNVGSANTANLVATLEPTGGVTSPSPGQTYGVLPAGGAAVSRSFTFTANGACGGIVTATLQLQDGTSSLGTVSFTVRLGVATIVTSLSESFDGVSAPALPAGWAATVVSGLLANWVTTNGFYDTAPNSAFLADAGISGEADLVSPVIPITSASAQLSFHHDYNLAARKTLHPRSTTYYDGGVLQISIGGDAFTDIVAAGGTFVSGGYNCTLATGTGNPLGGGQAWGGSSSGWLTTVVNLPAAAAGQNIQLKWACGTGSNSSVGVGWFVDTISIQDASFNCCSPTIYLSAGITSQPTNQVTKVGGNANFYVTASGSTPLGYQWTFGRTPLLGATSGTLGLTNVQTSQAGNYAVVVTNVAGSVTSTVATLTVRVPPSITSQPTNQTVSIGSSLNFQVGSTGTAPLSYQWLFNGTKLAGATSSVLALSNVKTNQAGGYSVLVTNSVGGVTSTVANLAVLVAPTLMSVRVNGTVVSISVGSVTGLSYQLEYEDALGGSGWTPATSWVPGTGSVLVLQDTNAATGSRFYRVASQ